MGDKLSVVVQVDLHSADVRLAVTGRVTETNQQGLHPLIDRARRVLSNGVVTVDLTGALHVEPAALDLLRAAIGHPKHSGTGSVEVLTRTGASVPSSARDRGCFPAAPPVGRSRYVGFHRRHPAQRRGPLTATRTGR